MIYTLTHMDEEPQHPPVSQDKEGVKGVGRERKREKRKELFVLFLFWMENSSRDWKLSITF